MKKKLLLLLSAAVLMLCVMPLLSGCSENDGNNPAVIERSLGTSAPKSVVTPKPLESPKKTEQESPVVIEKREGAELIGYIKADQVNIRESASSDSSVLGKLPVGTVVSVLKKDYGNGWSMIDHEGKDAFVAAQYIASLTKETEIKPECFAVVKSDDVNLRADASTSSQILTKLKKGEKLKVVYKEIGNKWSMVLWENRIAFMSSDYLEF